MRSIEPDHALELMLDYDGRIHILEHGLYYSLTLHDAENRRILGFDNAHAVVEPGSRFKPRPIKADRRHRDEADKGVPYPFVDVPTLIDDFFDAAERILFSRSISPDVVDVIDREEMK